MLLSFQCKAKYDCTGVSLSDQTKSPRSLLPFICLCFPLHPNHVHRPLSVQHFLNLSSCFSFLFCLSRIVAPVSPALSAPPCLVWISPASTSPNRPPHLSILHTRFCLTFTFMPFFSFYPPAM